MKKILNLFGLTILFSTISTSECNFNANHNWDPDHSDNPPEIHDTNYYQQQNQTLKNQITQIIKDIQDMNSQVMKEQICGSNTMCQELQQFTNSSTAELKGYQITIQDNQYQILLLQNQGHFTESDQQQAIKYLQTELTLLVEKQWLVSNNPDYSSSDREKLQQQILIIKKELTKFIPEPKGAM